MYEHPIFIFQIPIQDKTPRIDMLLSSPYIDREYMLFYVCYLHMTVYQQQQPLHPTLVDISANLCDELIQHAPPPNLFNSTYADEYTVEVECYQFWFKVAERLTETIEDVRELIAHELGNIPLGIDETHVVDRAYITRGILNVVFKMGAVM